MTPTRPLGDAQPFLGSTVPGRMFHDAHRSLVVDERGEPDIDANIDATVVLHRLCANVIRPHTTCRLRG